MNPVIKQDEYRQFALHCLELANTAASLADRAHLLRMAEAWLDLADPPPGDRRARPLPPATTRWSEGPSARSARLERQIRPLPMACD
jgi:hypothetical protein